MQVKTNAYLNACALALMGLMATAPMHSAVARGAGGGGGGGAGLGVGAGHAAACRPGHASAKGAANSNGPNAVDHDTGQARARTAGARKVRAIAKPIFTLTTPAAMQTSCRGDDNHDELDEIGTLDQSPRVRETLREAIWIPAIPATDRVGKMRTIER